MSKEKLKYVCKVCDNEAEADTIEEIAMKEKTCDSCRSGTLEKKDTKSTTKVSVGYFCRECNTKLKLIGKPCPECGSTRFRKVKSNIKR